MIEKAFNEMTPLKDDSRLLALINTDEYRELAEENQELRDRVKKLEEKLKKEQQCKNVNVKI